MKFKEFKQCPLLVSTMNWMQVFLCWQEKQNQKITSCIIASLPDSRHPVPQQVDPDLLPQSVF